MLFSCGVPTISCGIRLWDRLRASRAGSSLQMVPISCKTNIKLHCNYSTSSSKLSKWKWNQELTSQSITKQSPIMIYHTKENQYWRKQKKASVKTQIWWIFQAGKRSGIHLNRHTKWSSSNIYVKFTSSCCIR